MNGLYNVNIVMEVLHMNFFLNMAVRTLVAAAQGRAKVVLTQQAVVAQPPKADYRTNAGGWN
ncbi:hypothetical protein [Pseudoduganella plicata]|uniref:Uncharacterized protein n=1 Tax=Pseudoduganella plicata TaxID=321984 RepID=A0A4P7BIN8_9BURK|nr:hypothetical protein [Pseudoduganella plicata]QBQ37369.1 hypothetical protein E1742_15265 [Pseudoduganella plicata]GGZ08812.1 hypothetical protein GCM10007388_47870 [Pseudoduganella plicata]